MVPRQNRFARSGSGTTISRRRRMKKFMSCSSRLAYLPDRDVPRAKPKFFRVRLLAARERCQPTGRDALHLPPELFFQRCDVGRELVLSAPFVLARDRREDVCGYAARMVVVVPLALPRLLASLPIPPQGIRLLAAPHHPCPELGEIA